MIFVCRVHVPSTCGMWHVRACAMCAGGMCHVRVCMWHIMQVACAHLFARGWMCHVRVCGMSMWHEYDVRIMCHVRVSSYAHVPSGMCACVHVWHVRVQVACGQVACGIIF